MKKIIKEIKSNAELNTLLEEGIELNIYSNDERLLIKVKVPNELDIIDFLGDIIINTANDIIIDSGCFNLLASETLSSYGKYYSRMVEYSVK